MARPFQSKSRQSRSPSLGMMVIMGSLILLIGVMLGYFLVAEFLACSPSTSQIFSGKIEINFDAVRRMPKVRLKHLKEFTVTQYENYVMAPPGSEHYTLLEYLAYTYGVVEAKSCSNSE
eukprot:scaffold2043_cov166-Amphora_coffeaeformis.AAC.26